MTNMEKEYYNQQENDPIWIIIGLFGGAIISWPIIWVVGDALIAWITK